VACVRLSSVMRRPLRLLGLAPLLVALAFALPALAAHVKTVKVGDFFFVKDTSSTPSVRVSKGSTVRWKWVGMSDHNVTVIKGPVKFHSRTMTTGTYTKRMTKPGTYLIQCTIHGFEMKLVVKR
jgi:plastocyanin